MSAGIASFLAWACACGIAAAEGPKASVALLGGYGVQLDTILDGRQLNTYGAGFGARWGVTLREPALYLGATFLTHLGTLDLAADPAGTSTYRGSYHRTYFGPEIGFDLHAGPVLVRPWVGTGLLVAISRTSARGADRNDDRPLFYFVPGVLAGVELGHWLVGVDVRMPIVPAEPSKRAWAPAAFLSLGQHW